MVPTSMAAGSSKSQPTPGTAPPFYATFAPPGAADLLHANEGENILNLQAGARLLSITQTHLSSRNR